MRSVQSLNNTGIGGAIKNVGETINKIGGAVGNMGVQLDNKGVAIDNIANKGGSLVDSMNEHADVLNNKSA